jgi:hypothetical protein
LPFKSGTKLALNFQIPYKRIKMGRCSQKYAISDKAEIDVKKGEIESLKMIEHLL